MLLFFLFDSRSYIYGWDRGPESRSHCWTRWIWEVSRKQSHSIQLYLNCCNCSEPCYDFYRELETLHIYWKSTHSEKKVFLLYIISWIIDINFLHYFLHYFIGKERKCPLVKHPRKTIMRWRTKWIWTFPPNLVRNLKETIFTLPHPSHWLLLYHSFDNWKWWWWPTIIPVLQHIVCLVINLCN